MHFVLYNSRMLWINITSFLSANKSWAFFCSVTLGALCLSLPFAVFNTHTPEAACIRCKGGTGRGSYASHRHLLLFLLLLQCSGLQTTHIHCDVDFPPGWPLCILSIATAFSVRLSVFSWGYTPAAGWTLAYCGSSQQWQLPKEWLRWLRPAESWRQSSWGD